MESIGKPYRMHSSPYNKPVKQLIGIHIGYIRNQIQTIRDALEFTWGLWANPMENMESIEEANGFHWESIGSI